MTGHPAAISQLSAYYDNELPRDVHASVDGHVGTCASCRRALRMWNLAERELARAALVPESRSRRRLALSVPIVVLIVLLAVSGGALAVASGLVSGAASRSASLTTARERSGLPLVLERDLPGGWNLRDVQLTEAPTFRMVDLRYEGQAGKRLSVLVWSHGTNVTPVGERIEQFAVSDVPVTYYATRGPSASATFEYRDSSVVIELGDQSVTRSELTALIAFWIANAR